MPHWPRESVRALSSCLTGQPAEVVGVLRRVDPVVERPQQAVGTVLRVAVLHADVRAQDLARVGLQIAVGVLREDQAAAARSTSTPRSSTFTVRGWTSPSRKTVRLSIFPSSSVSSSTTTSADRLVFALAVERRHEAAHLDDPQAAVGIHVHPDRVRDHRLAGDELEAIARHEAEALRRILGRERRRRGRRAGRRLPRRCIDPRSEAGSERSRQARGRGQHRRAASPSMWHLFLLSPGLRPRAQNLMRRMIPRGSRRITAMTSRQIAGT